MEGGVHVHAGGGGSVMDMDANDKMKGHSGGDASRVAQAPMWKRILGLDVRSLALLRVCLAITCLFDFFHRAQDYKAMYTDLGLLPRHVVTRSFTSDLWMSSHFAAGKPSLSLFVWGFHLAAIGWMAVGYYTRTAMFVVWCFTLSLQVRNELCLHSGDVLLRCVLFFAMLMPTGTVFSMDAVVRRFRVSTPGEAAATLREAMGGRGGSRGGEVEADEYAQVVAPYTPDPVDYVPPTRLVADWTTVAFMAQIWIMYVLSVYHKTGPQWVRDYTASFYALQLDFFRKPFGDFLLMMPPTWLQFGTWAVWKWEKYGPMLYFSPIKHDELRLFALFGVVVMHVSFGLAFRLATFTFITNSAQMAFIPPLVWDSVVFRLLGKVSAFQPITLVYGTGKPLYRWVACAGLELGLLRGSKMRRAHQPYNGIMVIDAAGVSHGGTAAVRAFASASPLLVGLGWLLKFRLFKLGMDVTLACAHVCDRVMFAETTSVTIDQDSRSRANALVTEAKEFFSLTMWAWRNVLAGAAIVFVMVWVLGNVQQGPGIPGPIRWIGPNLHLAQSWSMFSPNAPSVASVWRIEANLTDDTRGNLFHSRFLEFETLVPLTDDPPTAAVLAGALRNHRWFKLYESFTFGQGWPDANSMANDGFRAEYGRFICREWNYKHDNPNDKLKTFQWYILHYSIAEDGSRHYSGKQLLWDHWC